jgi:hypothetical protein
LLTPETPFPNVGSYALLIDCDSCRSGGSAQRSNDCRVGHGAELARILRASVGEDGRATERTLTATIALPLRDGASGTKTVPFADLIDATPLTGAEGKEMVDLDRELRSKPLRGRAAKQARHDALKRRAIWAPHMQRLIAEADRRGAVGQGGRASQRNAA